MSRVAKNPIVPPSGVTITINGQMVQVKGAKGEMSWEVHENVTIHQDDNEFTFAVKTGNNTALAGTTRAIVNNMVIGTSEGFQAELQIIGVGYRAQMQGDNLALTLGFSHDPCVFTIPEGVTIETPTNTEVLVKGVDKQKVFQTAANIRKLRPPEPYKGKGIRFKNEFVKKKEAKKK